MYQIANYRLPCGNSCGSIGLHERPEDVPIVDIELFKRHKDGCVPCQAVSNQVYSLHEKRSRSSPIECDS